MIEAIKKLFPDVTIVAEKNNNREKDFFVNIINGLSYIYEMNLQLSVKGGIDLIDYAENYFSIIDSLLEDKYGEFKTDIITWFILFGFDEEGNPQPFSYRENMEAQEKTIYIKTPEELWNLLQLLPNVGQLNFYDPDAEDPNNDEE